LPHPRVIRRLIDGFTGRRPMRTTSLIVTVFGDVVSQHGGSIWLGSLVKALAPMGVSERLVRTSVFRLVQEGWLEFERVGRRSFYRFSEYGDHEYARAARRIYGQEDGRWNGRWQLLIPLDIPEESRERFKRSLLWQGFRAISPGTFAKPGEGGEALRECLEEFDALDKVVLLEADTLPPTSDRLVWKMVHESWRLNEVAQGYREFLQRFRPLLRRLRRYPDIEPEAAFIARTLLIHDYRRILLKDTRIPEQLLPAKWPGDGAQQLTALAYRSVADPSVDYITGRLEGREGPMPAPGRDFHLRFGEPGWL